MCLRGPRTRAVHSNKNQDSPHWAHLRRDAKALQHNRLGQAMPRLLLLNGLELALHILRLLRSLLFLGILCPLLQILLLVLLVSLGVLAFVPQLGSPGSLLLEGSASASRFLSEFGHFFSCEHRQFLFLFKLE